MFPVTMDRGATATVADEELSQAAVERVVVNSHTCQWNGWRYLYLSFGIGAWILGGECAGCAASFALTTFFAREDRKPKSRPPASMQQTAFYS